MINKTLGYCFGSGVLLFLGASLFESMYYKQPFFKCLFTVACGTLKALK